MRILIVDDEKAVLSAYRRVLNKFSSSVNYPCSFEYESDSVQALEKLKKENYDVLLSDVKMPSLDGIALLKHVKKDPASRATEVIIVTGVDDNNLKQVAIDHGATDLLSKPVLTTELIARLKSTLELKKSRDDLVQQNQDLKHQLILTQKMELIGILAGGAVHDLNNILGVIKGYGQLIQFREDLDDRMKQGLDTILNSVDRATAITKQIHSFSRSGGDTVEKVVLNDLLDEVMETLRHSVAKHSMLSVDVSDNDVQEIWANPTFIYQIVMNLAINAIQAMNGKGELNVTLFSQDNEVHLIFKDSGPGIPEAIQEKVFDPLFTTKKESGGSGLGLSIVKQIINEIGGEISLKSSEGEGSEFRVVLPKND